MISRTTAYTTCLENDDRKFRFRARITLTDNTLLNLTEANLWQNGFEITSAISSESSFDVGGFVIGRMTIVLNNIYGTYSGYDFIGANVDVSLVHDTTIKYFNYNHYTVEEATNDSSLITLTCLDNAHKFERPYSESNLVYPAMISSIVRDACDTCGVTYVSGFDNSSITVFEKPDADGLTFLKVIAWCAQVTGNYAKIDDVTGRLKLDWFETQEYEVEEVTNGTTWTITNDTFNHISDWSSLKLGTDDVVITGVRVNGEDDEGNVFSGFYGSDGYVLDISGNDLVGTSYLSQRATTIGNRTVGLAFRAFSGECLIDPCVQVGDLIWITDRNNLSYKSFITGKTIRLGGYMTLSCGAKSPTRNSGTQYSEVTRAIVAERKRTTKTLREYDNRVQAMTALISRGFGMYVTEVTQEDGSIIPYMHDEEDIGNSSFICYMTSEGVLMEVDGDTTAAVDRNGNALLNTLTARGINADWINTGELVVQDVNGNETFYVNCDTGVVRIVANSFSLTGNSIQDIAQAVVDSSEIGGRNIFVNSSFSETFDGWDELTQTGATLPEITTEDGYACCHYTGTLEKFSLRQQNITSRISGDSVGQKYIVSFDMKLVDYVAGTTNPLLSVYFSGQYLNDGVATELYAAYGGASPDLSEYNNQGWVHVVVDNIYFEQQPTLMRGSIYSRDWTGDLYFKNLKMERGTIATDWTPAPEDYESGIANATTIATNASSTANSASETANQALELATSAGGLVAYLDNSYQGIPTDANGDYESFPNCSTTMSVFWNATDVSSDCVYTTSVTSGITGSWNDSTRTYTVTGMTTDSGTVTIAASYNEATISKKFSLAKVKQGSTGADGQQGESATMYELSVSPKSVKLGESLEFSPDIITVNSYYRTGYSTAQTAFSGYLSVQVCNNDSWGTSLITANASNLTFTLEYTDEGSSASVDTSGSNPKLILPSTVSAIRVQLKANSSSSVCLDQEEIIILVDASSLTQESIFNKLTNNGETQGIYLSNGKLYVNASYIKTGTLSASYIKGGTLVLGGSNNTNGILQVRTASNITAVTLNNNGITANAGYIGNWKITANSLRKEVEGSSNNLLLGSDTSIAIAVGAPFTSGASGATWNSAPFRVLNDGSMYSTAGYIGNWKITSNSIRRVENDGYDALLQCPSSSTSTVLSIGAPTVDGSVKWTRAPFYIKATGALYATSAKVVGTFESTDGDQTVQIVEGIIKGKAGSTSTSLIDMSAYYSSGGSRNIAIKGEYGNFIQAGTLIRFEINNTLIGRINSNGYYGDVYPSNGINCDGTILLPSSIGDGGVVTSWYEVHVRNGLIVS